MIPIRYHTAYRQGVSAPYIDWVGGGNFDGYLVQQSLYFTEQPRRVELHTRVIHRERYDGDIQDSVITGTYEHTDKETLTLEFEHFRMRGKVLGAHDEIMAFSVWDEFSERTEVYLLDEPADG